MSGFENFFWIVFGIFFMSTSFLGFVLLIKVTIVDLIRNSIQKKRIQKSILANEKIKKVDDLRTEEPPTKK